MNTASATTLPGTRTRLSWALVPVGLLLCSAISVGSMAWVAARDPNFATERDYYQKSIRWDQVQAQAAENQRLDYRFDLASSAIDGRGQATIELRMTDHDTHPVRAAVIQAQAFANAFSGELYDLKFSESAPGVYTAGLTVQHPGLWVFRVSAQDGVSHVTVDFRRDLLRRNSTQ